MNVGLVPAIRLHMLCRAAAIDAVSQTVVVHNDACGAFMPSRWVFGSRKIRKNQDGNIGQCVRLVYEIFRASTHTATLRCDVEQR